MAHNCTQGRRSGCVPELRFGTATERPRGSTPRTRRLAEDAATRPYTPFEEQQRLCEQYASPEGLSPVLRTAHTFVEVHPRMTPVVREDELIVGARLRAAEGDAWGWVPDGTPDYIDRFALNAPPDRPDIQAMARRGLISPQGTFNHKVVDYAGFIRTGSRALAERARAIAETRQGEERDFALAFARGHEAMTAHAQAYVRACLELAESAPPARAAELREIARICAKVPAEPAETFHEALQSLWFAYMTAGDATGRIDVYLNNFYEADLAAGRITPERALELIECFLVKLHGDVMAGVVNVSSVQTMTLGGVLPDGTDATNALTRLFLRGVRSVRLLRPTVYIRCHDGTPQDVLELAVTMLGEGLAEPNFYGDRPIVAGLTRVGVPIEEARDYALSGCTEVVSPGRGNWGAPNGWINLALLVDEALRDAAQAGASTAEALWDAVVRHVAEVAGACRVNNIYVDERARAQDCRYHADLLMPVCLERCCDLLTGGAASYYGHWEAMGLPNAAEMMLAAETLAVEGGESLASLYQRLDADEPALRARLKDLSRFGNDCERVDGIAARLIDLMADALERRSTPLRKALVLGHLAGGENMHIGYGCLMGPTLDGRRAGETLADSLAGSHGRTRSGPTAVINSLCRLDHSKLIAGNVSTLRLTPAEFRTPEQIEKVAALIRTFVAQGGSQLQVNVVDAATLRAAQTDPEAFEGLMVRVAGYSAAFVHVGRTLQDEIIARTEGV